MDMNETVIRIATPDDAAEILNIYAPYVTKTAVTFEDDVPSLPDFKSRIEKTLTKYPYIIAVYNKEPVGYAYTGAFHSRAAYSRAAETSVYVKEAYRRMGIGRLLYQSLEKISALQNILNLNACISYPDSNDEYLTDNSVRFHTHMGYSIAGEAHKCGYKFGRWYNIVWMEKFIGEHTEQPPEFIKFPDLSY